MTKRLLYFLHLFLVSTAYAAGDVIIGSTSDPYAGMANNQNQSGIYDMGGTKFIDRSVEITGALQVDKWLELINVSTPTTPSATHARFFYNNTQQKLCVVFGNGTQSCVGPGSTGGSGILASATAPIVYNSTTNIISFSQTVGQPETFTSSITIPSVMFSTTNARGVIAYYPTYNDVATLFVVTDASDTFPVPRNPYQNTLCMGAGACSQKISGEDDTAFGALALYRAGVSRDNTAIGATALNTMGTAIENTAIGSSAMGGLTTGSDNTCIGVSCMQNALTPFMNTGIGISSLNANNGAHNVGIGFDTLATGTRSDISSNTVVGDQALFSLINGNNNVNVGYQSSVALASGTANVVLGYQSDFNRLSGSSNVIVGQYAGFNNTIGNGNILIGFQAGPTSNINLTNSICIGFNCAISSSNTAQIGGAVASGNEVNLNVTSTTVHTYFSDSSNLSSLGKLRLSNSDIVGFRNGTNTGDLLFGANSLSFAMNSPLVINPISNQLTLGSVGGTNAIALNAPTPSANRIYTLPDVNIDANFVMTQGSQTITGPKTYTSSQTITNNLGITGTINQPLTVSSSETVTSSSGFNTTYGASLGSVTLRNIASGTQCIHADSSGNLTGTGADCASGFGTLTGTQTWSGQNTFSSEPTTFTSSTTFTGNVQSTSETITNLSIGKGTSIVGISSPTVQKFTSGSGTYTAHTNPSPLYINVIMIGGGGGGSGSGTTGAGNGGTGGTSFFGTSLSSCTGGAGGGFTASAGAAGGTANLGTGPIGTALSGGKGGGYSYGSGASSLMFLAGASGGNTPYFAGGGQSGTGNLAGTDGETNKGGGGQGGGTGAAAANFSGTGGGSGAYINEIITSPSATYIYGVGAGGTAGSAGTSGFAGGAGGSGYIEVREFYQ